MDIPALEEPGAHRSWHRQARVAGRPARKAALYARTAAEASRHTRQDTASRATLWLYPERGIPAEQRGRRPDNGGRRGGAGETARARRDTVWDRVRPPRRRGGRPLAAKWGEQRLSRAVREGVEGARRVKDSVGAEGAVALDRALGRG